MSTTKLFGKKADYLIDDEVANDPAKVKKWAHEKFSEKLKVGERRGLAVVKSDMFVDRSRGNVMVRKEKRDELLSLPPKTALIDWVYYTKHLDRIWNRVGEIYTRNMWFVVEGERVSFDTTMLKLLEACPTIIFTYKKSLPSADLQDLICNLYRLDLRVDRPYQVSELPSSGEAMVVIASIEEGYYFRVFSAHGEVVVEGSSEEVPDERTDIIGQLISRLETDENHHGEVVRLVAEVMGFELPKPALVHVGEGLEDGLETLLKACRNWSIPILTHGGVDAETPFKQEVTAEHIEDYCILDEEDKKKLADAENFLTSGPKDHEKGALLEDIRRESLNRGTCRDFDQYCRDKFGHSKAQAYRYIAFRKDREAVEALVPNGTGLPEFESQTRPIRPKRGKAHKGDVGDIWVDALASSKAGVPTQQGVLKSRRKVRKEEKPGVPISLTKVIDDLLEGLKSSTVERSDLIAAVEEYNKEGNKKMVWNPSWKSRA